MAQAVAAFELVKAALVATGIKGFVARTVASFLLTTVTNKLFARKLSSPSLGLSGVQVTTRSALEYRKIVYGKAMVSGPIVYSNVAGTNNKELWHDVALVGHEIEDYVALYIDGDEIPKANISWTAGTTSDGTGTGAVNVTKWVGSSSTNAVYAFYYLGHADQPVCGALNTAFADIGTNNRLRGVAHVVWKLIYEENTAEVWKQGQPRNLKAVIKGRKIYDPRLDSTNGGSGSHRYATESTWEWSENPALAVADYLVTYMGVDPATDILWSSVADAADDCDATVSLPSSGSENRFTCNGALSLGRSHKDNLAALLSSMDGKLSYAGGQWRIRASMWEASSVNISADDLAGDVEVRGSAPRSERANTIRGFYADPDRNYQFVEFQHVTNSSYVTRDNGETITRDLELPMTNSEFMAQRIAFRQLEQADNQVVAKLKLNAVGAEIAVGDVVSVTLDEFSWSSKTFRVLEWQKNSDGTHDVTLREDASASYSDPATSDYTTKTEGGAVTIPSDVVPAPSGLTATSVATGIRLDWTNPAASLFDYIDVYESATSAWSGKSLIGSTRADTFTITYDSGTTRYFWVRARNDAASESDRSPDSDTSTVTATSGSGADGADGADGAPGADGADGADAITSHLTNEAHVVDALDDGTGYSLTSAGGTHKVFDDVTDVTTSATHSVSGTATKNGLTMAVVSGTGVYSLSGASWTSDLETFTLQAVYNSKTITKEYTIAKARDGKGIGTVTVSGGTIQDNDSVVARAGVRVNNDGTIDKNVGGTYTQISSSTDWIIPNAHDGLTYHARLTTSSGDGPTHGSSVSTWHAITGSPEFYIENTDNDIKSGTWLLEISGDGGGTVSDSGSYSVTADNT